MTQLSFRSFQSEDAQAVPELFMRAIQTVYPDIQGGKWTSDLEHVQERYIADGGDFLVGVDGDTIVAEGGLHKLDDTTAEMKKVAVSPEAQEGGIGQKLVAKLEDRARELGFSKMVLDTTLGQAAARHIYEKSGYALVDRKDVAHPSGETFDTFFYEKFLGKSYAPTAWVAGKEKAVAPGDYQVLDGAGGAEASTLFAKNKITWAPEDFHHKFEFPGVRFRGWYKETSGLNHSIGSFLYNKINPKTMQPETTERVIVVRGIAYGVHPDHEGQEPTWYLVGPQIGTIDHETGQVLTTSEENVEIPAKNFSMACITDGPLGEAILANPQ